MRHIALLGVIILLVTAGCGQIDNDDEPVLTVFRQAILSDAADDNPVRIIRTLRIIDSKLDPEEIMVPTNSIVELVIDSDQEIVLSFPELDEKIIESNPNIVVFEFGEAAEYEFICVSGCDVPVMGNIIVG